MVTRLFKTGFLGGPLRHLVRFIGLHLPLASVLVSVRPWLHDTPLKVGVVSADAQKMFRNANPDKALQSLAFPAILIRARLRSRTR
jgi:hypothetical protein